VKKLLILAPFILVLAAATGSKFASVRRDLLSQREAMDAQWVQVQLVLTRRAQLAPELADLVKGHAQKEIAVFGDLADSRAALAAARTPQETMTANAQLSYALWSLLALSENDPKLRGNTNFQRLQDELETVENNIAVERQKYNEALEHYNAQIQRFPDNIVASLSGFTRNDAYFRPEIAGRTKPTG
jgi:LemA protein